MKKGFTLIELLAVIVILAIIALIATPIVLNIINDAKKSAQIESAKFYINAVEQSIALSKLNNQSKENATYQIMENGNLCEGTIENNVCTGNELEVEVKGEVPKTGSIALKNGDMSLAISNGEYCIIKSFSDSNITVYDNGNSCLLPGTAVVSGESQLTLYNSNGQNLTNYKIYGNSVQGELPSEYQQVEYIESTGIQYIDTQYIPTHNTKIYCKFAHNESVIDTPVFGARNSDWTNEYILWSHPTEFTKVSKVLFNDSEQQFESYDLGTIIEFESSNTSGRYNESTWSWDTYQNDTLDVGLILFGLRNGTQVDSRKFSGKIWSFRLWENNILVRDFIPCYRKTDNVIGMYDLVENKFYTNGGDGAFIKGNDVPESVGDKTKNLFDCFAVTASDLKLVEVALSNKYGTTINSIEYTGEIVATQTSYPDTSQPSSYNNGFFTIGLNGLEVGKKYTIIYDYEILSNPLNDDSHKLIHNGNYYSPTINGNRAKYVIEWGNKYASSIEFRMHGRNMKYTNFMIFEGEIEGFPDYEPYGKYKIPIKVSNDSEAMTTNIYLDEPLRKVGDYADYIDFENGKVVRNVEVIDNTGTLPLEESLRGLKTPTEQTIELPNISTFKGTTTIEIDTSIKPSNVEITY